MEPWSDERVWEAMARWRWVRPGAKRVVDPHFEAAVTPGSYALTYVYDLTIQDPTEVGKVLAELRRKVQALGGTGARVHVSPKSQPQDLGARLLTHGYLTLEETEVMVWELREGSGRARLPDSHGGGGVEVREVLNEAEYDLYLGLSAAIFHDPPLETETARQFRENFRRQVRETGGSGRFLAWKDGTAIGEAGMELEGPTARLYGSGVLPEHRGQGVYGALVRKRCEQALQAGAEVALVTARVGTSGPILKRRGFRPVGSIQVFEARW